MVETIKPRGAIAESLVIDFHEFGGRFFCTDVCGNQFEIPESEYYEYLNKQGRKTDENNQTQEPND